MLENKYSTNNTNTQIKVKGWKEYTNSDNYKVYYNDEYVWFGFSFTGNSGSITTSWSELGANVFSDTNLRPKKSVFFLVGNVVILQVRSDNAKVRYKGLSTINAPFTIEGETMWKKK